MLEVSKQNQYKKCPSCQKIKSHYDFYKSRKDGLQSRCKDCQKFKHSSYSSEYSKEYYEKTNGINAVRKKRANYRKLWTEYFIIRYGETPYCQVCGLELKWPDQNYKKQVVHFDHKSGDESWQRPPVNYFSNRPCIDKNIIEWEKCNFGILCIKCNASLPTNNREQWLKNVIKYTFSGNTEITTKGKI